MNNQTKTERFAYFYHVSVEAMTGVLLAIVLVWTIYLQAGLGVQVQHFIWIIRIEALLVGMLYGIIIRPTTRPLTLWLTGFGVYYVLAQDGKWISLGVIIQSSIVLVVSHLGWLIIRLFRKSRQTFS